MSFPRYLKYKDSGVEWLGQVPEHWAVKRLKHIAANIPFAIVDGPFGTQLKAQDYREMGVPLVRISNLSYEGKFSADDLVFIEPSKAKEVERSTICRGDIVIGKTGATIGKTAMFDGFERGIIASSCLKISPDTNQIESSFLLSVIVSGSFQQNLVNESGGSTRDTINITPFGNLPIAVPPLPEQTRIAEFLEQETAKIDELVAEQQRLMALLKEKRQAVISHAVTKGLNPKAAMKPSGVEWLGEVPEHWEVMKASLIGILFGSEQVPEEFVSDEGELPFIKVGSMSSDSFAVESWDWFVDRTIAAQYKPRSGFIVFPKRGAAIFLNKVNIVDRPSLIDPNLMGWEIGGRASATFIAYALKSRKLDKLADVSTVPQINNKHIGPERFPVPPLKEQLEIVAFLDAETVRLDTLTAEAQHAIDLLQERRTALISAAVTGQIDVRNH